MEIIGDHLNENKQRLLVASRHHLHLPETQRQAGELKRFIVGKKGKASDMFRYDWTLDVVYLRSRTTYVFGQKRIFGFV